MCFFAILVLKMDLYELIPHINTSENAIQFLRDRGILRSEPPLCTHPLCVREMTEVNTGRRRASQKKFFLKIFFGTTLLLDCPLEQ